MLREDQEEVINRLRFRGRKAPHKKTCVRRGAMGIKIVNEVLRAPTYDSAYFALDVIKCLYVYESMLNIPRYSLDKALVSLCDKVFITDIYHEIEERIKSHLHSVGKSRGDASTKELCENSGSSILYALNYIDYDDPLLDEVIVGYSIIKFRKYGIFEEKIVERIEGVSDKLKNKAKRAFGELLDSFIICRVEAKVRSIISSGEYLTDVRRTKRKIDHKLTQSDREYIRENYPIVSYIYDISDDLDIPYYQLRKNFNVEYFIGLHCWNSFTKATDELICEYRGTFTSNKKGDNETTFVTAGNTREASARASLKELCFYLCRSKMYDLELMYEFIGQSTSFERAFIRGYVKIVEQRFKMAKEEFKRALEILTELKIRSSPEILLHIYDLLSLSHLFCGEYFECMFYLDRGISLSHENQLYFVASHFLDCRLIAERIGHIPGPTPRLSLDLTGTCNPSVEESIKAEEKRIINNRIYTNLLLEREASSFREIRTLEHFTILRPPTISADIHRILGLFREYTIISLYCIDGELFANDFKRFVRIETNFVGVKERLSEIIAQSRVILKRNVVSDADKARWWMERICLDTKLGEMLCELSDRFSEIEIGEKIILVLDETTTEFPFESMPVFRDKTVYRIPSLEYLECPQEPRPGEEPKSSVFYLLDPENNLHRTQRTIMEFLNSINVRNGVVGRSPSTLECREANNSSIVLYFGHGSGSKHLKLSGMNKAILLFGCNSAKLLCVRNYKRNGSLLRYINRNSMVVGCLWEVTDRDIDRFSIKVIEGLISGNECLGRLISRCRNEFKMKYLNGASVVVYGLPQELVWNPK